MITDELQKLVLFRNMTEAEIRSALQDLNSIERKIKKGSIFLHAGDTTDAMGIVLEGSVTIESNDMWGNRTILSHVDLGQYFAETYALLPDEPMLVDVRANEDCRILFLYVGFLSDSSFS